MLKSSSYQHSSSPASTFFLWVFHWEDKINKAKSRQHPLSSRSNCCARYSNTFCSVFTSIRKKRGTQRSQENRTENPRIWPTVNITTLRKYFSPSSSSHKHHKQIASVWWGSIWIQNRSCQTTTQKGQPWSQPNEKLSSSLDSSISIKDTSNHLTLSVDQQSILFSSVSLPCWS